MLRQDELIGQLQGLLDSIASPKTRDWWERYLRHTIRFRGVGIPDIRQQLAAWRDMHGITRWEVEEQLQLALQLFASPIAEDKLAGILYLQDYLFDQLPWATLMPQYEQLYVQDLIFDWNTCDWFCVRVLGATIALHGPACAEAIAAWREAANLWQARSSVVAFVPVAAQERYYALILTSCAVLIQRQERFAKTAVGWILRDMSKQDPDRVRQFVERHLGSFSPESLKNALKYDPVGEQKRYLQRLKAS